MPPRPKSERSPPLAFPALILSLDTRQPQQPYTANVEAPDGYGSGSRKACPTGSLEAGGAASSKRGGSCEGPWPFSPRRTACPRSDRGPSDPPGAESMPTGSPEAWGRQRRVAALDPATRPCARRPRIAGVVSSASEHWGYG